MVMHYQGQLQCIRVLVLQGSLRRFVILVRGLPVYVDSWNRFVTHYAAPRVVGYEAMPLWK